MEKWQDEGPELFALIESKLDVRLTLTEKVLIKGYFERVAAIPKPVNNWNEIHLRKEVVGAYLMDYGMGPNTVNDYWHHPKFPEYFRRVREKTFIFTCNDL